MFDIMYLSRPEAIFSFMSMGGITTFTGQIWLICEPLSDFGLYYPSFNEADIAACLP
jgi:hypothetical protein